MTIISWAPSIVIIIFLALAMSSCTPHWKLDRNSETDEITRVNAYYVMDDGSREVICEDVDSYSSSSSGEVKIACSNGGWERTYYNVPIIFEKEGD